MDPRYPRVGLAANTVTLTLVICISLSVFLPFVTSKGWGIPETVMSLAIPLTLGISWWAKKENENPTVHSHGDSESQYEALENLPTMVSLDDTNDFVNPNTAAVIASIIGESSHLEDGAVKGAINTLSTGDIGRSSAEAVAVNKSLIEPDFKESLESFRDVEPLLSEPLKTSEETIIENDEGYAKFDVRGFQTHGIPSIPLPEQTSDKNEMIIPSIELPEMPDLNELIKQDLNDIIEDKEDLEELPPLELPDLPDFE